jgi:hypothetical protein
VSKPFVMERKRFRVGAKVNVVTPGVTGVVTENSEQIGPLGEYWHKIKTEFGERKEPGCNLELLPPELG